MFSRYVWQTIMTIFFSGSCFILTVNNFSHSVYSQEGFSCSNVTEISQEDCNTLIQIYHTFSYIVKTEFNLFLTWPYDI
jgi:hypothetical protein